ncbi:MAG: thiazole biosynthesis protein [Sedimentisphaerales bacterium]|nr:thiazole biosynthesis protein [Sedimentisphaerales bacterium]
MIETEISRAITQEYFKKLTEHLENDAVIVGGGPAGITAGYYLAKAGIKTIMLERKLSIGGGIWGGAAGFNVIVTQDNEIPGEFQITSQKKGKLYLYDSIEFASALTYRAKQAGLEIFNLTDVEDVIIKSVAVEGVVVNHSAITSAKLHVDPFCISSKYVIDSSGHPAEVVHMLLKRKPELLPKGIQEGFMNVKKAEAGVVEKTGEIFPGLYIAGMSVCAVYGLPRMGPIFGGMLKSGKKVAQMIIEQLEK